MDIVTKVNNAAFNDVRMLLTKLGDRRRDFIRCYNTSSVWCHKYAQLVMRGMSRITNSPLEHHHIVPIAYYRAIGLQCDRLDRQVCRNNFTKLSKKEHILAHFYMVLCCNMQIKTKLIRAFYLMYYGYRLGNSLYNTNKQADVLLDFNIVTEPVVLAHLNSRAYPTNAKSNRNKYKEGRVYFSCTKYPLVPIYSWQSYLNTGMDKSELRQYPIALIYTVGYLWVRKVLGAYTRFIRTLAIDCSIKKNIRFNDSILRPIPRVYAKRFLAVKMHQRVWVDNLYDTIEYLDNRLKLPPLKFCMPSLDMLGMYNGIDKSTQLLLPLDKKLNRSKRYKCTTQGNIISNEPIVLLHGCDL